MHTMESYTLIVVVGSVICVAIRTLSANAAINLEFVGLSVILRDVPMKNLLRIFLSDLLHNIRIK